MQVTKKLSMLDVTRQRKDALFLSCDSRLHETDLCDVGMKISISESI